MGEQRRCKNCSAIITQVIPAIRDNDIHPIAPQRMNPIWPGTCYCCGNSLQGDVTLPSVCEKLERHIAWNWRPFSRQSYWVVARSHDDYIDYCKQLWIDQQLCKYIPSSLPGFVLDGVPDENILYAYQRKEGGA